MTADPIVFLDVDTQRDFLAADGALAVPGGDALIPTIQRLVAYAFTHGVPVVSSTDAHDPADPEFAQFPRHCVTGTRGQLKVEGTTLGNALVVPNDPARTPEETQLRAAQQIIVEKQSYNLFDNPHAERIFRALSPRLLVVFGVAPDSCVRSAVRGRLVACPSQPVRSAGR